MGDTERLLNEASIQQLNLLTARAKCSLPHDRVYGVLRILPESVSSTVTINYRRQVAEVFTEFSSTVLEWFDPKLKTGRSCSPLDERNIITTATSTAVGPAIGSATIAEAW